MSESNERAIQSISWISCVMVGGLALASFSLSFEALRKLAIDMKVVSSHLGWVFPLIIDGAIIVFSLSALRSSLRKESSIWLRLLVIFATVASVFFNIAHVENIWLAQVLASTPPVLLFLSFEALMHTIQQEMLREAPTTPKKRKERSLSKDERIAVVSEYLKQGMNVNEIAEILPSVSLRTIQRDISKIGLNEND